MFRQSLNRFAYLALALLLLCPQLALAAPKGGVVTNGNASINQSGNVTNIDQSSQKATINWQGFSVAPNETVNFNQPNTSAMTLNRVIGNERSVIEGAINANGKVYLINSNGVLFSKGSQVNVGGLVASTLNITDEDFMNGNFTFQSDSLNPASVINQGQIIAGQGGYVALMGGEVHNEGLIAASMGTVSLNSGKKVSLNFNGDSLLSATIDEAALNALVTNKEAIIADGGIVIMTARAAGDILSAQVNNEGLVRAQTVNDLKGEITIFAYGGTANIAGTLDASAPNGGDGGFIETSGAKVKFDDSAVITTKAAYGTSGTWLLDPNDIIIAATGGDVTPDFIMGQLSNNGSSIIQAIDSLYVNGAISWSKANSTLTLTAGNNIYINAAITATGATAKLILTATNDIYINAPIALSGAGSKLDMTFGGKYQINTEASYSGVDVVDYTGGTAGAGASTAKQNTSGGLYGSISFGANGSLTINSQTYTLIYDMAEFIAEITDNLNGYYALAQNITAPSAAYQGSVITGTFNGTLAGLGHVIDGLTIDGTAMRTALFRMTGSSAHFRDLGLINVNINSDRTYTAALVADNQGGSFYQVYSTGVINGAATTGGLIAQSTNAAHVNIDGHHAGNGGLELSFSTATVSGTGTVGGLVGIANGNFSIIASHARSAVTANGGNVGGLVGYLTDGNISNSYFNGTVIDTIFDNGKTADYAGGLVGNWRNNTANTTIYMQNSFAEGFVSGYQAVGGLIGGVTANNDSNLIVVVNSFANVEVAGIKGSIGGLAGTLKNANISYAHATGRVYYKGGYTESTSATPMGYGGLVGSLQKSTVDYTYATGAVDGADEKNGGLIGVASNSTIQNSYAKGAVSGIQQTGGLIGAITDTIVRNCQAMGSVTGQNGVGGLIGYVPTGTGIGSSWIYDSSAIGDVYVVINSGYTAVGGGGGLLGGGYNVHLDGNSATGSIHNNANASNVGGLVGSDAYLDNGTGSGGIGSSNNYTDVKAEEAARVEAERQESIRQEAERQEQERQRQEAERQEQERQEALAAERQENIDNTNAVSSNVAANSENHTEKSSASTALADTSKSQTVLEGLPSSDGTSDSKGSGFSWGGGENGEPVSLAMLGLQTFSATVKTIITDEGEVYDLEEAN